MKFTKIAAIAAMALSPFAATAGNLSAPAATPTVPPIVPVSSSSDWSGGYAGLSYGIAGGDYSFTLAPIREMADGDLLQIYGGYQIQRGALVYGGELAIGDPNDTFVTGAGGAPVFDTANVIGLIDLKGRVGYASGDFLVYGVLGYSVAEYADNVDAPIGWDINGFNYGVGVDYAITDNFLIGAEYLMRDLSGDNPGGTNTATIDLDTLSIRATYKF